MKHKLNLKHKNVYGRDLYYPNNETANGLCKFAGKKTLNTNDIKFLIKIGYEIEYSIDNIEVK